MYKIDELIVFDGGVCQESDNAKGNKYASSLRHYMVVIDGALFFQPKWFGSNEEVWRLYF